MPAFQSVLKQVIDDLISQLPWKAEELQKGGASLCHEAVGQAARLCHAYSSEPLSAESPRSPKMRGRSLQEQWMEQWPDTCLPLSFTLGNRAGLVCVELCLTIVKISLSFFCFLHFFYSFLFLCSVLSLLLPFFPPLQHALPLLTLIPLCLLCRRLQWLSWWEIDYGSCPLHSVVVVRKPVRNSGRIVRVDEDNGT